MKKPFWFYPAISGISCGVISCTKKRKSVEPYNFTWENNSDIETIISRITSEKFDENLDVSNILNDMDSDGKFKSVEYLTEKKNTWHPLNHLVNILKMQIALNSPNNRFYGNSELKNAITLSLKHWITANYHCDWNDWYNDIGVGMYIPDIMLFGIEGLSKEEKELFVGRIKSTLLYNRPLAKNIKERKAGYTGGNLTDQTLSTLKVALAEKDGNTIMWLRSLLERELKPFPTQKYSETLFDADGIKEDMSFLEHWQLLYFGGYGEVFLDGINRYIKYTKDTQFGLPIESLDDYSNFILDGIQFATRNGYRDINASGRGISRIDSLKGIFENMKSATNLILDFKNLKRYKELQSFYKNRFENKDLGANGHKYFYESDYNAHNDENYMATVRHASNRTRVFEVLNDENPFGYYGGFGATAYYIDGDEYFNILPLYDWNKIPGTTTRQGYIPQPNQVQSYNEKNTSDYVGGVSDGKIGLSYIDFYNKGVKSTQGYFMFSQGVVCLGCGITSHESNEIVTCINQTKLKDTPYIYCNGKLEDIKINTEKSGTFDFVYEGNISYIPNCPVTIKAEHMDGDWKDINPRMASHKMNNDLFTIYFSHGKKPTNSKYAYTVLMNTTPQNSIEYINNPTLNVLANNKNIQAVYDSQNNILEAVFHKAENLTLPNGDNIKVSAPCLVILYEKSKEITISTHNFKEHDVTVTYNNQNKTINVNKRSQKIIF